jgi:hypothetical protein
MGIRIGGSAGRTAAIAVCFGHQVVAGGILAILFVSISTKRHT